MVDNSWALPMYDDGDVVATPTAIMPPMAALMADSSLLIEEGNGGKPSLHSVAR